MDTEPEGGPSRQPPDPFGDIMPPAPRRRGRKLLSLALLLAVIALAGASAWQWSGRAAAPALLYETAPLDRGAVERSISATGAVRARVTVTIGSQLSGQVSDVLADFNGLVKVGDLLARIDPRRFETRVHSAEAELAIARANVVSQQGALHKAKALLAQAERTAGRQEALAAKGTVSQNTLDDTRAKLEAARADLEIGNAQISDSRAQVAQKEAALAEARLDLSNTEIRSPIDGVVTVRSVEPGQTVAASLQAPILFTIAQDLSSIQIEAQVDEADIGQIAAGNPVTFSVDAFPDRRFSGEVEQVRLAATEAQNVVTYTVVIRAENPQRKLLPGMTATVRIITGSSEDALRAPNEALRFRPAEDAMPGTPEERRKARTERRISGLARSLDLDASQQQAVRDALEKIGAGRPGGGDGGTDAAERRMAFEKTLRKILSEEQMKRHAALQAKRDGTSRGMLWVLDPRGKPEPRGVRLGLGDASHTEIIGGKVEAGDKVILRTRTSARAAASLGSAR